MFSVDRVWATPEQSELSSLFLSLSGCRCRCMQAACLATGRPLLIRDGGNQSIGQYLSVHKDSFSNLPTNRGLEEVVVVDWPEMMKFNAS
uniref:Uncharacterized protein n=1 Tax=Araneus ventricosus TaxID=182803 RepID=A0A4Y2JBT7_ARAVE|nr:hypothetical protein AVEN_196165-1 [Araneus ventricosus]